MATTVVHTIKASGGDYTSLSAWEAAQQRNLVTLDEIEVAECYGFIDTTATSISGWTTGINNYIIVRAHSSAKATVPITTDGSKYLLRISGAGTALAIFAAYTQIYDIQVETTTDIPNIFCFIPTSNVTFRNCVAKSALSAEGGNCWFFQGVTNVRLQNCIGILVNGGDTAPGFSGVFVHDNASAQYDNCTAIFAGPNRTGWRVNGSTVGGIVFRNCLSANLTRNRGGFSVSGTGIGITSIDLINSTNNASRDGTAYGVNPRLNQNFIFANLNTQNYHLDWMDIGARQGGVDLSASATASYSDDFDGNTRTFPWHIGALGIGNSPNGIQLGRTGNSNINVSSTGTSPITIR